MAIACFLHQTPRAAEPIEAVYAALKPEIDAWRPLHQGDRVSIWSSQKDLPQSALNDLLPRLGVPATQNGFETDRLDVRIESVKRRSAGVYEVQYELCPVLDHTFGMAFFRYEVTIRAGGSQATKQKSPSSGSGSFGGGIEDGVYGDQKPTIPLLNELVPSRVHAAEAIVRDVFLPWMATQTSSSQLEIEAEASALSREEIVFLLRRVGAFRSGFNPEAPTMRLTFGPAERLSDGLYAMKATVSTGSQTKSAALYTVRVGHGDPKIEKQAPLPPAAPHPAK